MSDLRSLASAWLARGENSVVVEVTAARGSVPRAAGTRMLVGAAAVAGTIGGGHLELKAIDEARAMLRCGDRMPRSRHYPLGPALGQCCGGTVSLGFAPLDTGVLAAWAEAPPRFRLQLYGAGHVGRAIARALAPLGAQIDWIDEREDEFPRRFNIDGNGNGEGGGNGGGDGDGATDSTWPPNIRKVCVDPVEAEVRLALPASYYLVLTHRHDLDLRITAAILRRGDFAFLGLIGSKTKRARFVHRFESLGIAPATIARMTCPIGLPGIDGKEPEVIAAAVAAQLLLQKAVDSRPADGHAPCFGDFAA